MSIRFSTCAIEMWLLMISVQFPSVWNDIFDAMERRKSSVAWSQRFYHDQITSNIHKFS